LLLFVLLRAWVMLGVKGFHCPLFLTLGALNFSFSVDSSTAAAAVSFGSGQSVVCYWSRMIFYFY
jgi:hypothetical protein